MKNIFAITITLIIITSPQLAYSKKTQAPAASEDQTKKSDESNKIKPYSAKATKGRQKTKKPTYYQGHSFGLQNYPGKTIDAGANTGMLPTNSSSPLMGNDVTF